MIQKAEGPALKSFWDKHGNHYTGILKKQKQERAAKDKVITFMDKDYPDLERLKQVFRNIINSVANDQEITGESAKKLKALLGYHEKYALKNTDFKHFTVAVHPEFTDTRCFFVVKQDNTKEDFSFVKCINRLVSGFRSN